MKATCFKSETTVSNDFPPLFVTVFCGIFYPFISIPVSLEHTCFIIIQITCQSTFLPFPAMVLDNSNSPYHIGRTLVTDTFSVKRVAGV